MKNFKPSGKTELQDFHRSKFFKIYMCSHFYLFGRNVISTFYFIHEMMLRSEFDVRIFLLPDLLKKKILLREIKNLV